MNPTQDKPSAAAGRRDITPREREVLQWLADGVPSSEVAQRLGKPAPAVRAHVARLLHRLHAATPAEALARLDAGAQADDDSGGDPAQDAVATEAIAAERAF